MLVISSGIAGDLLPRAVEASLEFLGAIPDLLPGAGMPQDDELVDGRHRDLVCL